MCLYKYSYVIHHRNHGSLSQPFVMECLVGAHILLPLHGPAVHTQVLLIPIFLSKYIQSYALYDHAVV